MKCTDCNGDTTVRKTTEVNASLTKRYRRCISCSAKLTTVEQPIHMAHSNLRKHNNTLSRLRLKVEEMTDIIDSAERPTTDN